MLKRPSDIPGDDEARLAGKGDTSHNSTYIFQYKYII